VHGFDRPVPWHDTLEIELSCDPKVRNVLAKLWGRIAEQAYAYALRDIWPRIPKPQQPTRSIQPPPLPAE